MLPSTLSPPHPARFHRFCWDRLLLQEVASTRGAGAGGVLVLDEAQERSVASDLLQGLLRDASLGSLPGDPKVVVITDPALEPQLQAFWGNPPTVHVPGRPGGHPTPEYRDSVPEDRVEAACQVVLELCQQEAPGDVLVYLPSEEVKRGKEALASATSWCPRLQVMRGMLSWDTGVVMFTSGVLRRHAGIPGTATLQACF